MGAWQLLWGFLNKLPGATVAAVPIAPIPLQAIPPPPPASSDLTPEQRRQILALAEGSSAATYSWLGRGRAPIGYIKGMALTYGRVYKALKAGNSSALAMAVADKNNEDKDALSWYAQRFKNMGWDNSKDGADTLRHVFDLLTGLGMRESSGEYTEGRDSSAGNVTANTAEAGLFQQSWGTATSTPEIPKLFGIYSHSDMDGFLDVFKEGVNKPLSEDWGDGVGRAFQHLAKTKPAFAVEAAAVGLRNVRKEWGPIVRREAELQQPVDDLFKAVQKIIDNAPATAPPPVADNIPTIRNDWPTQADCDDYYGNPRNAGWVAKNLMPFIPPWQMIDEDTRAPVHSFLVHKKVFASITRIFDKAWIMYGKDQGQIDACHLNLFSGSYVFRNIRGGSHLSMHSYGIAIDIASGLNELGAPYDPKKGLPMPFVKLWENEGWIWGGRWRGRPDAMHFQAAKVYADDGATS